MSELLLDIGSVVTIVGLVLAVLKLYLEQRKANREREFEKEYLRTLSELVKSMQTQQQAEKEQFQWNRLRDIGKMFGWIIEHSGAE